MTSLLTHPDGKTRCFWANPKNPLYVKYHDEEWGVPFTGSGCAERSVSAEARRAKGEATGVNTHDDARWFELLVLEGAQAGLSWETVLKKRAAYRKAFYNFHPAKVAKMSAADVMRLMQNEGIIRNRLKIESAIRNAKAFLKIQKEFGSFDAYIWPFVGGRPIVNPRKERGEIPASTKESDALSRDLKKRGFNFVGSTICYALMQASGLVNDHLAGCFRANRARK